MRSSMLFALGGSVALVQAIAPRATPVSSATTPASSAVIITVEFQECDQSDPTLLLNCVKLGTQDPLLCGEKQGPGYITMFEDQCCRTSMGSLTKAASNATCNIECGAAPEQTCGGKNAGTKRQAGVFVSQYLARAVAAGTGAGTGAGQNGGFNFNFPITNNNNLNVGSGSAGSTGTGASGATNGNGGTGAAGAGGVAGAGGAGSADCPGCDAAAAAAAAAADCDNGTTGTGTGTTGTGTGTTGTTGGGAAPVAVPDGGAKAAATGGMAGAGTTPATVMGNSGQRLTTTGASLFAFFGAVMILL